MVNVKVMESILSQAEEPDNLRVEPQTYSLPGQVSRGKCKLTYSY